ncbi:neural cell adhesion molecule L1-like protein isoform X2 [Gouania willdenowi]|uniref:neural cell adhesion molecule L1-like protein isoform X2 n=1 Tax=Gouania willdenowi TaxID=441366 RepID=UPI001054E43C|nr:neural cell adhesion molecule L1-like protein isoform X2 [Gouania willdenowi]
MAADRHILLVSSVSISLHRVMGLVGSFQLVLLLTLTFRAAGINIPLEVEQPPTMLSYTRGPIVALPFDNNVTLSCEAKGNPAPLYRWTKDNADVILSDTMTVKTDSTTGTLVLQNKQLFQFQGKYRCYASNKLGTAMTEEIELIVTHIPKFQKETLQPIVVNEGDPIILECNPPETVISLQVHWMSSGLKHIKQDERVTMGTDGNLYFSNALQQDSRPDYCCIAAFSEIRTILPKTAMSVLVMSLKSDNGSSNNSDIAEAPPARKPSLLLPPGVQTVKVLLKGETLHLECIPAGLPTPDVTWMKMGGNMTGRVELTKFQRLLTVPAVEEQDQGKYMCTAENSAGKAVHYFDVIVEEPPKWLAEPPQSQLTVIGSDVHIECSVGGNPLPDITWRRNGEIFKDDTSNVRVLEDTLVFDNLQPVDSAVYQCEASNSHGSILANVNLVVMNMAPLILTRDYQEYAVVLGADIVMNCSVFSSPPSQISWSRGDSTVEGERFIAAENGQSLKIIQSEKADSGKYVCSAINTEDMSSVTAVLDVKDPTRILDPPQDIQIISGTAAQLTCQADYDKSLRGTFEMVWMKDGEEIPLFFEENSKYLVDDDMLQIMNVNSSDQGLYTCIARTSLDQVNATALLTVMDIPDAPTNLEISELELRRVRLSWLPGSDHNSAITEFVVEYEESKWEPGKWRELQKVIGNQATAELTLHGHLNYQFRVYAVNEVGPGPPSEPTRRHETPPAPPDRNPENIKIHGHLPHQMDISWEPLLPIEHNGPGLEYKVSFRKLGVEDVWQEHLVKRHSFVVRNTTTFIPYEIKIQSRNSHGWGPEPKVVTGYSGEDVPTAAPQDIAVEVINTTVLRVSWTPVPNATVRGHLGGYDVHWVRRRGLQNPNKTLDEHHSLTFPGKKSHVIVPGLEPFSEYKLTVNVFNKKGNGPKSDPVIFNTPEGVPQQVPILTASNPQKDSILLVWGPPLKSNGFLSGYYLQYHLLNDTSLAVLETQEVNISDADTTQLHLRGLERDSGYRFHLSACTRAGCGPSLMEESRTLAVSGVASQSNSVPTKGWLIGTMCVVALLTLIALVACFLRKNKAGKYAVKENEDLRSDLESQEMNDDTFNEYSDSDEKPLRSSSLCSLNGNDVVGDSFSRDSLVDYTDCGGEFSEDGSFIGEYSGFKHRDSVSEPSGLSRVTA